MLFNQFLILAALGFANAVLPGSNNVETGTHLEARHHAEEAASTLSGSRVRSHPLAWNPLDYELIRNALTRYSYSLDDKNWDGLSTVYAEDVKVYYPEPQGLVVGLSNVTELLRTMIEPLITQHSLTTQNIDITGDKTATVRTYGRAIHFGTGALRDQSVTVWGKYEDKVVKLSVNGVADWRIVERRISYQGPFVGNGSLIGLEG